jgi:hypothetical protein
MALHSIQAPGPNILVSIAGGDAELDGAYVSSHRIRFQHSDGTFTDFRGSGISFDPLDVTFTLSTGQITSLRHYDQSGILIDTVRDFAISTAELHYAIYHGFWLYGPLSGDDVIRSGAADPDVMIDDIILSGLGNDTIYAGTGNDELDGSFGSDVIYGQDGNDILRGDTDTWETSTWHNGNDKLFGGAGDDMLYGGTGDDELRGGTGFDTATFDQAFADLTIQHIGRSFQITSAAGVDTISGIEQIQTADGTYTWNAVQQSWLPDPAAILI